MGPGTARAMLTRRVSLWESVGWEDRPLARRMFLAPRPGWTASGSDPGTNHHQWVRTWRIWLDERSIVTDPEDNHREDRSECTSHD